MYIYTYITWHGIALHGIAWHYIVYITFRTYIPCLDLASHPIISFPLPLPRSCLGCQWGTSLWAPVRKVILLKWTMEIPCVFCFHVEVSQTRGTSKSSTLTGLSIYKLSSYWGNPHLWKPVRIPIRNSTLSATTGGRPHTSCPCQRGRWASTSHPVYRWRPPEAQKNVGVFWWKTIGWSDGFRDYGHRILLYIVIYLGILDTYGFIT